MKKELKCPKCGSEKRVKSGFNNKKQRYHFKECKCHCTVSHRGYQSTLNERQYSCTWKEMALGELKEFLKLAMFLS